MNWQNGKLSLNSTENNYKYFDKEVNYKDGERDGKWTEWRVNGQKEAEGTYKNGEQIEFTMWDEDGNEY